MSTGFFAERCKVDLAALAVVGDPGPLPPELQGTLSDADLADLSWTDPALGFHGFGFWPVVDAAPPKAPAGHVVERSGWTLGDTTATPAWIVRPMTNEETTILRERRKAEATDLRWKREVAGIVINGIPVATDDRSKTLILGKRAQAQSNPAMVFRWKAASGEWVDLTGAQIIAVADAVADHVQACFDREGELHDSIDAAGDVAAVLAIDLTAGWPS